MIVLSQDKDKIVNFDNLIQVYITQDEEKSAYFIRFETVDSLYDDLGEYKTEKRAKEVFQELIETYCNMDNYLADFLHTKIIMYKMPEE